jgi:hypothetical protein
VCARSRGKKFKIGIEAVDTHSLLVDRSIQNYDTAGPDDRQYVGQHISRGITGRTRLLLFEASQDFNQTTDAAGRERLATVEDMFPEVQ